MRRKETGENNVPHLEGEENFKKRLITAVKPSQRSRRMRGKARAFGAGN